MRYNSLVTLNPVRRYAFLLRLGLIGGGFPLGSAVSRLFFNCRKDIDDLACAAWRRRDGFDFLAFYFFLDHGERAFAVSLAGPSTSMLQGQNRRYTMKPINKIQAKR